MIRALALLALVACDRNQYEKPGGTVETADPGETGESGGVVDSGEDSGGDSAETEEPLVDADEDGWFEDEDCDDADPNTYPGAEELCDGKDNDCDGEDDLAQDLDADGLADCEDFCPIYAAPLAEGGDGRSMSPLGSIQEAVDLAGETGCYEVRAYQGTYYENVNWNGWPVNAESLSGPETTIIDGQARDSVVAFETAEDESARIYGFTLTNGGGGEGPGVRVRYASPTIEGNLITGNVATEANWLAGGIRVYEGSPTIIDNEITGNDAGYGGPEDGCDGGGINVRGGAPYIAGNLIAENTAGDGGGIWIAYSDAIIVNNQISANMAWDDDEDAGGQGGGINVQIAGPTGPFIASNIISDNVASMFGGGIVTYEANASYPAAQITNNTIVYNEVTDTDYGAGVCQWRRTTPVFRNNIIAFNHGVGVFSENDMDATFTYNLVHDNEIDYDGLEGDGGGNLDADPLFRDASDDGDWTNDDFSLRSSSPAIDAGDPDDADADGGPADIGATGGPYGDGW